MDPLQPKFMNPATGYDGICWDFMPDLWTTEEMLYDKEAWVDSDIMRTSKNDIKQEWDSVRNGLDEVLRTHGYERTQRYYNVVEHNEDTIVFFCHLGVTMVMLAHLLGISPPALWQGYFLAPSSVTILNSEERVEGKGYFRVQVMGDTSHLYASNEPISNSGYYAKSLNECREEK